MLFKSWWKKYFEPEIHLNCILSKSTVSRLSIICISECKYVQWNIGLFEYQNQTVWLASRHPVCGIGWKSSKNELKEMTSKRKQMESSFTQPEVNVFDFVIYQISFNPFIWIFSFASLVPSWRIVWDKKNTQCCEKNVNFHTNLNGLW